MLGKVLSLLAMLSMLWMVVGIISPKVSLFWWKGTRHRSSSLFIYGGLWFAFTMATGVLTPAPTRTGPTRSKPNEGGAKIVVHANKLGDSVIVAYIAPTSSKELKWVRSKDFSTLKTAQLWKVNYDDSVRQAQLLILNAEMKIVKVIK